MKKQFRSFIHGLKICYNLTTSIVKLIGREAEMNKHLDANKALEAIVYISRKTTDLFHIVKILYYADTIHLEKHGRLITGDSYVAMEDGPVPSGAYDLIKCARGDIYPFDAKIVNAHPEKSIKVEDGRVVTSSREADLDCLSESDIECLDASISLYASMDGKKLWKLVHEEEAYKKTPLNRTIQLSDIILSLPNGEEVMEYLNS